MHQHIILLHPEFASLIGLKKKILDKEGKDKVDEPVLDPESVKLLTRKELKKKKKKTNIKTKEYESRYTKLKSSVVWNYFKPDENDPKMATCQVFGDWRYISR